MISYKRNKEKLKRLILAAQGKVPCDLLLKNAYIVDVFTGDIFLNNVGIVGDTIAGIGTWLKGEKEIDLTHLYLVPGFIDAHMHIESTMLIPSVLSRYLIRNGTTTVVSDPHEIANVMGIEGVRSLIASVEGLPLDYYFTAPSCVPATHNETSGAFIGPVELAALRGQERVIGLSEVMDFISVVNADEQMLEKLLLYDSIHGHAPMLRNPELMGYVAAGIDSDHETVSYKEGLEKLRAGMFLMIREGSSAKNLEELLPLVDKDTFIRCCLVTDDLCPKELLESGHLNGVLKKAIALGLSPVMGIRLVSISPASYLGLKDRGCIAPGKKADMVILKDLKSIEIHATVIGGNFFDTEQGFPFPQEGSLELFKNTVNFRPLTIEALKIPKKGERIRVITIVPDQIITGSMVATAKSEGMSVVSDPERDILKTVVIERHKATGNIGKGFVQGFGLKRGAIASSIAHDAHNIICVGVDDASILTAINRIKELNGGIVYAFGQSIVQELPLPYAGLMCDLDLIELVRRYKGIEASIRSNGCPLKAPFMTLSFLSLSVIPELKLTDKGLVDVNQGKIIDIFV